MIWISNIQWDTDGEFVPNLPRNIITDLQDDNDAISDWLSDTYGFCHNGFTYEHSDFDGTIEEYARMIKKQHNLKESILSLIRRNE